MPESKELPWTGERLVTSFQGGDIVLEHLHRYAFAAELVAGKDVLDIACGEGYGSNLLAASARSVTGVDIPEEIIRHARSKYVRSNLTFHQGNCLAIPIPNHSVDIVVSFETLVHFAEHEQFLAEVRRVLRPGGIAIVSTPDKAIYTGKLGNRNDYHLRELSADEFESLLRERFAHVTTLSQRVGLGSFLAPTTKGELIETGTHRGDYEAIHFTPGAAEGVYLIGVASDAPLPALKGGLFEFGREEDGAFITPLAEERKLRTGDERRFTDINSALNYQQQRIHQLDQVVASAMHWQSGPWFKRAFHRWHPPGARLSRLGFLKKLERSIRKRFFNRAMNPAPLTSTTAAAPRKPYKKQVGFLKSLERSIRKRRKDFVNRLMGREPADTANTHAYAPTLEITLPERATLAPMPKVLAWYLPQFHPIPENDAWWGKGFTEWRNVTRAYPLFPGHVQPQLPADLGFYDLRLPEVRQHQADLARKYGIDGFVYHYYWFKGRKVLETPLEEMLRSGAPDFPFCINWANENWTRRWDGLESEILLHQEHSLASDVQFIRDVLPLLKDRRYITCDGRPMLIVYRPELLKNSAETAAVWRDEALRAGLPGLHLCAVQFLSKDPRPLGFDALIEFPPHYFPAPEWDAKSFGVVSDFKGNIYDFPEGVRQAVVPARREFPFYRGAMPGWDNTARRLANAAVYHGATPEIYQYWLHQMLIQARHTATTSDHFVFINAWNEWAEGAHLEPDQNFGYAWLEATRNAVEAAGQDGRTLPAPPTGLVSAVPKPKATPSLSASIEVRAAAKEKIPWSMPQRGNWGGARRPVLCVSHDAARAGAQLILFRLVERLAQHEYLEPWLLLRHGGALEDDFRTIAPVLRVDEVGGGRLPFDAAVQQVIRDFRRRSPLFALCNTVVSSDVAKVCDQHGIPVLAHVLELPTSIDGSLGRETIERVRRHARRAMMASAFVRDALVQAYQLPAKQLEVVYYGVPRAALEPANRKQARQAVLREFGWEDDAFLVLGCGSIHPRKGTDLFVQAAIALGRRPGNGKMRFLWVGQDQDGPTLRSWCEHDIAAAGLAKQVQFAGERVDPGIFFAAADAFALTSREDPFPTVNLEAMAAGLPVVAFDGAGGAVEAFGDDAGLKVPYLDVSAMAGELARLAENSAEAKAMGARARRRIETRFTFEHFFQSFLELVERDFGPVAAKQQNPA